jgi:hypothetical protein
MSKEIIVCQKCNDDFCGHCFQITPCSKCEIDICEECFDTLKELTCCGSRVCPDGCKCDCYE